MAHADELLQNINGALSCLTENEGNNALGLLHQAVHALETVQQIDPKISSWIENLKNILIQVSETESDLHRYLEVLLNWIPAD